MATGIVNHHLPITSENKQFTISDTTNGFIDTGKSQADYVPFAYFMPFNTNMSVRFSNLAASSGGNIRMQIINCVTNEVVKSGTYYILIFWLHR